MPGNGPNSADSAQTSDQVGEYSVSDSKGAVKFWPVVPGVTPKDFIDKPWSSALVAPYNLNTLVLPPDLGIFDIIIEFTKDPLKTEKLSNAKLGEIITKRMAGKASAFKVPLVIDPNETRAHISFAVRIPKGKEAFEGKLELRVNLKNQKKPKTAELMLKVEKNKREANLFVFFIGYKTAEEKYAWFKTKVIRHSNGAAAGNVGGATVKIKVLRDQFKGGFPDINRRTELQSLSSGYVAFGTDRDVLAMPYDWPIIYNASKSGFVNRGLLVRFKSDDIHHNLDPVETLELPMTMTSEVDLSSKKIVLDPGHGVVYDGPKKAGGAVVGRRCQEWYVAHKVAEKVQDILTTRYKMPKANIFWTRTAGFGLIEPDDVHKEKAPELGAKRYVFNMKDRTIRVKQNSVGLKHLSDLLLTRHDPNNDDALPVPEGDRRRLLTNNASTINTIVDRLNKSLGAKKPHTRVRPGSVRWDTAHQNYVYTKELTAPKPGHDPVVSLAQTFPVTTADWFKVDNDMLNVLASRSAAWSIQSEVGSGPGADSESGRLAFTPAARAALQRTGAFVYMRDRILASLPAAPHPWLEYNSKGMSPVDRLDYFTKLDDEEQPDLFLTIHENAGGGKGAVTLVSVVGGSDKPPMAQIDIGKLFLKYLDPFDHGTRSGGVTKEEASNQATLLHDGHPVRERYAYLETEFMDAPDPDDPSRYTYDRMVEPKYIETLANQIVEASIEFILDKQSDLASLKYKGAVWGRW